MDGQASRAELDRLVAELRPKLHRYCARMTGSVIDGEDVVQDALVKALDAWPATAELASPEGWLFRIAHNTTLDFLRRRARHAAAHADEDVDMIAAPSDAIKESETVAASLQTLMRLPPAQRSAVILRDVLGYSLGEIGEVVGGSLPAAKSALQRGRTRLKELAQEPDDVRPPALTETARRRLEQCVAWFNARDFDAVRRMLADDVRLELVNRLRLSGRDEVEPYFHRYALADEWRFAPGLVDGRAVMLVFDRHDPDGRPASFVLIDWQGDRIAGIRDFLFARYALDGAELRVLR
jgi:RNA polymerase sigma-70 factor (ECF subfamily)